MRALALFAGLVAALADRTSFDCIGRNLAVGPASPCNKILSLTPLSPLSLQIEFAIAANPQITTAQLQEVADALVGSATSPCNITIPADVAAAHEQPRFRPFPIKPKAASFYVSVGLS